MLCDHQNQWRVDFNMKCDFNYHRNLASWVFISQWVCDISNKFHPTQATTQFIQHITKYIQVMATKKKGGSPQEASHPFLSSLLKDWSRRCIQWLLPGLIHKLWAFTPYRQLVIKAFVPGDSSNHSSFLNTSATKLTKDKLIIHKFLVSLLMWKKRKKKMTIHTMP